MAINVTINGSGGITGWSGTTARPGEDIVGTTYDASAGAVCVCRYKFTTDGYGATAVSFTLNNVRCTVRGSSGSDDSIARMRFALTAAADAYVGYKGNRGSAITDFSYAEHRSAGSLSVKLLPNTVYYLWIFPASNFSGTTRFNLGSCTLKTSGVYGTASSISAGAGTFGSPIPITLSNSVSGVTNTVTVRCGGITKTLATKSAASNFTWTPSLSEYGPAIPDAGSAQATITATTFYGSAEWGSRTRTVTVRFPDEAGPVISAAELSCDNGGTAAEGLPVCVQGHSKARASITAAGQYGASVSSYALSVGGTTVSGAAAVQTSAPLPVSGSLTATLTVTDSRGLSASVTRSLTVEPYAQPSLTGVSLIRADQTGAPAEDGTWLRACATGIIAPLDGHNAMTMTVANSTRGGSYGAETPMQSGTPQLVGGLNADLTYTARITLTDALGGSASATGVISSRKWAMKFNADATAVGFGKAPEADRVLEIPADWELVRGTAPDTERAVFSGGVPELLADMLQVKTVESAALNVSSGSSQTVTADASRPGFTPIGVVGYAFPSTNSSNMAATRVYLGGGNTLYVLARSITGAYTGVFRWYVLYRKDSCE